MSAFPDTISPSIPFATGMGFSTLVGGPYRNGRKVRQMGRPSGLYRARPKFPRIFATNYIPHYQFFMDRHGSFESFTWFDFNGYGVLPEGMQWPLLTVGTLDGSTVSWDAPYKGGASGYVLDRNGTTLAGGGVDYSITDSAGTDGRDLITLTAGGTAGHLLRASAFGRAAFNVTFDDDEMSFDSFHSLITTWGLGITEVVD